jgi:lysophospholipase L1-like esterase
MNAVAFAVITALLPDVGTAPAEPKPVPMSCLRVMALGDSITEGVNGGYRNRLYEGLTEAGCGINYVGSRYDPYAVCVDKDQEGHPGFTIGDIEDRVEGWLAGYQPDYVLLMIGTNDIAWWTAQSAAEIADHHARLVDKIRAARPNAWVIVGSIPPIVSKTIAPNGVDRAQLGRDLNAEIKTRIEARIAAGQQVRFADVYSALELSDLYDGVHPTQAAHAKVAEAWLKAMLPVTACLPREAACGP